MKIEKTIFIIPMGKPRMTKSDKWKKRECVQKYWAFKDIMKMFLPEVKHIDPIDVSWIAYFPIPKSWSKKKRAAYCGKYHRARPDRDNIDKAILDALFENDAVVSKGTTEKRWDDGAGPRIEISITGISNNQLEFGN